MQFPKLAKMDMMNVFLCTFESYNVFFNCVKKSFPVEVVATICKANS